MREIKRLARQLQRARFATEPLRTINAMTNRERSAWARAGYPKDEKSLARFGAVARRRLAIK